MFKVVVLAAGFLFTVMIGVEQCHAFSFGFALRQEFLGFAFGHGFGVGLRICKVVGLQRFRRRCRGLGRLLLRMLALPFPLLSCETFAHNGVQFLLSEGLGCLCGLRFRRGIFCIGNRGGRGLRFRRGRTR